ncbi:MAG: cytochrome C oxidase subunit IV family protein [Armatimonadetes bacterium]|nr:cytochrome C oxidase subunit IV family protein [Armatimonadota bacterium]MDE2206814.1 cytochrome C oxidase subunit IV family protein [Armatimonadota bacterium]
MTDMEHEHAQHSHHVTPPYVYFVVYVLLVILLFATVGAYKVDLGAGNNVIAMVIAAIKAVLVVLFFMQVKYSSKLTWVWASLGFVWLIVLFSTLGDYIARGWLPVRGWQ